MLSSAIVLLIGVLHIWILILEMFLWEKPAGLKAFANTPEMAAKTRVLAANQGLYNGFLAAGLLWGCWLGTDGYAVKTFFLLSVFVAGIYGGLTASKKIILIQAVPAALGLICLNLV